MSPSFRLLLALLLMPAPAALAADRPHPFPDQQTQEQWDRAQELARRGIEELLQSFDLFRESIPQFGAPYIDGSGNIVIPRRHPAPSGSVVPEPAPERT